MSDYVLIKKIEVLFIMCGRQHLILCFANLFYVLNVCILLCAGVKCLRIFLVCVICQFLSMWAMLYVYIYNKIIIALH